jgi:hypothetical protein
MVFFRCDRLEDSVSKDGLMAFGSLCEGAFASSVMNSRQIARAITIAEKKGKSAKVSS